jgi:outer membrane protein assembly factor BamB
LGLRFRCSSTVVRSAPATRAAKPRAGRAAAVTGSQHAAGANIWVNFVVDLFYSSGVPKPRHMGALLALLFAGCRAHAPEVEGCGSDKDCKLDRVCEANRCAWPQRPAPSFAAALPPAVVPPVELDLGPPAQGMFRFDAKHRGRSPFLIPRAKPELLWTLDTLAPVTASVSVSADGLALGASHSGKLFAIGKDGKPRWSFTTGDLVWSTPAIAADGTVYVGSDDDDLYALDGKSGKLLWKLRLGACQQTVGIGPEATRCDVDAGPTIGPDGTLYTGGDAIHAIAPDGKLRWRFATGGHVGSAPAVTADGTVIAGCQDNSIYAVTPDGRRQWEFRARDDVEASPAIEEDGTIYIGSDDNRLYALSPQGQLAWAFTTGDDVRASAAIGRDGTVYIGSFDGLLYALRRDGTLLWAFRTGDRILSSALVDASGAVLVGSQDDRLYAIEPDGKPRWSVELGGDVDSSPILGPDGTIYVGSDDGKLYALRAP